MIKQDPFEPLIIIVLDSPIIGHNGAVEQSLKDWLAAEGGIGVRWKQVSSVGEGGSRSQNNFLVAVFAC